MSTEQIRVLQQQAHICGINSIPAFSGDTNCANLKKWLFNIEGHFRGYFIEESLWVRLATIRFKDNALRWWNQVRQEHQYCDWQSFCDLVIHESRTVERWTHCYMGFDARTNVKFGDRLFGYFDHFGGNGGNGGYGDRGNCHRSEKPGCRSTQNEYYGNSGDNDTCRSSKSDRYDSRVRSGCQGKDTCDCPNNNSYGCFRDK